MLLVLAAGAFVSCGGGDEPKPRAETEDTDGDGVPDADDPDPYASDEGLPERVPPRAARWRFVRRIGRPGTDDGVTFTVKRLEEVGRIPGGRYSAGPIRPRAGGKLVRADVTISSPGVPDPLCGADGLVALDTKGRTFRPSGDELAIAGNEDACAGERSSRATGTFAFHLPRTSRLEGLLVWNGHAPNDPAGRKSRFLVKAAR